MSRVDAYMAKYHEHTKGIPRRESVWDVMDVERELDALWDDLSPAEQFKIRTDLGLVREDEK
jgi:hypothetical protein